MKAKPVKSKSELIPSTTGNQQSYDFLEYNDGNKPYNFVGLYKSAAETRNILEKRKLETTNNDSPKTKARALKREQTPQKNKVKGRYEKIDVAQINIDASSLNTGVGVTSPPNSYNVTSTPNGTADGETSKVKSIMKNSSDSERLVQSAKFSTSNTKPKKRNKSVSFMLDDNEEIVIKRTKSDNAIKAQDKIHPTRIFVKDKKQSNRPKKKQQAEKENTATTVNKQSMDVDNPPNTVLVKKPTKLPKFKKAPEPADTVASTVIEEGSEKKKRIKKIKKKKLETMETDNNDNQVATETKNKKLKKKKKPVTTRLDMGDGDGEPVTKSRKKDIKPDIAEHLENLNIGDNAHTLTNLLDEMTVVDKNKRKKLRQKFKKNKSKVSGKEETDKPNEGKEKVRWKKRKWNKDKKGDFDEDGLSTTVIVENLPLRIMLTYKKLLADYFGKYGLIKNIGIAEVYAMEALKPVFTTTIYFYSEGAAEQALQEDDTLFEGSRIRIKRPLPPTDTTIVVRSYAEMTDQNLSTAFVAAGKIRSIRHLVKGKKAITTAFIEFHGPDAVEAALKIAANIKIGGKKIHVAKFEPREKKKKDIKHKNDVDSAADADSESSND